MIMCFKKRNSEKEFKWERTFDNGGINADATYAVAWAIGKTIHNIYFEVNGTKYEPKHADVAIIKADLISISKQSTLDFGLTDEDFLL